MISDIPHSCLTTCAPSKQQMDLSSKCSQLQIDTKSLLNSVTTGWANLDAQIDLHHWRGALLSDLVKFERDLALAAVKLQIARETLESMEAKGWVPPLLRDLNAALLDAIDQGDAALCCKLHQAGASTAARDGCGTALMHAAIRGDTNACLRDGTLLYTAASNGHLELFLKLLSLGADPLGKTRFGTQALHGAAFGGHMDIVQALIGFGADVNERDIHGRSALHHAAQGGHRSTCRFLIARGSEVHDLDKQGRTALHRAAGYGQVCACLELLQAGADIHRQDRFGDTALARAAKRQRSNTQMLLIAYGADPRVQCAVVPSSPNCLAMTPLEAATRLGNSQAMIQVFDTDADPSTLKARISAMLLLSKDPEIVDLMLLQAAKVEAMQAVASLMAAAGVIPRPSIQLAMAISFRTTPAKVDDESDSLGEVYEIQGCAPRMAAMVAVAEI